MSNKIGFIGLGIMGKPMALNLVKHGYEVLVFNRSKDAEIELEKVGATRAENIAQLGRECEVIFTILPNGKIVKDVVLGENGLISTMKPNSIVVDMSSVSPIESQELAKGLQDKDCFLLDAPVSGGEPKAIDGTLAFMVGGEGEIFDRVKPYFDVMGSSALLIGPTGSGSMTKLANQIIVNLNIAAMSEALVLAQKGGADPQKVFEAIRGGLAGSAVLEAKAPMVVERNFKPGGRIDINLKDIKNVMATAHEIDVPLPMTGQLLEIMQALKVDGKAGDDHGGIIQYFEKLAGVEVKKHTEELATVK